MTTIIEIIGFSSISCEDAAKNVDMEARRLGNNIRSISLINISSNIGEDTLTKFSVLAKVVYERTSTITRKKVSNHQLINN